MVCYQTEPPSVVCALIVTQALKNQMILATLFIGLAITMTAIFYFIAIRKEKKHGKDY